MLAWQRGGHVERGVAPPFTLHGSPVEVRLPPPRVGEHRDAILSDLGMTPAEIAEAAASGAFGRP